MVDCPLYTVFVSEKDFIGISYLVLRSIKQGLLGLQNLAVSGGDESHICSGARL